MKMHAVVNTIQNLCNSPEESSLGKLQELIATTDQHSEAARQLCSLLSFALYYAAERTDPFSQATLTILWRFAKPYVADLCQSDSLHWPLLSLMKRVDEIGITIFYGLLEAVSTQPITVKNLCNEWIFITIIQNLCESYEESSLGKLRALITAIDQHPEAARQLFSKLSVALHYAAERTDPFSQETLTILWHFAKLYVADLCQSNGLSFPLISLMQRVDEIGITIFNALLKTVSTQSSSVKKLCNEDNFIAVIQNLCKSLEQASLDKLQALIAAIDQHSEAARLLCSKLSFSLSYAAERTDPLSQETLTILWRFAKPYVTELCQSNLLCLPLISLMQRVDDIGITIFNALLKTVSTQSSTVEKLCEIKAFINAIQNLYKSPEESSLGKLRVLIATIDQHPEAAGSLLSQLVITLKETANDADLLNLKKFRLIVSAVISMDNDISQLSEKLGTLPAKKVIILQRIIDLEKILRKKNIDYPKYLEVCQNDPEKKALENKRNTSFFLSLSKTLIPNGSKIYDAAGLHRDIYAFALSPERATSMLLRKLDCTPEYLTTLEKSRSYLYLQLLDSSLSKITAVRMLYYDVAIKADSLQAAFIADDRLLDNQRLSPTATPN